MVVISQGLKFPTPSINSFIPQGGAGRFKMCFCLYVCLSDSAESTFDQMDGSKPNFQGQPNSLKELFLKVVWTLKSYLLLPGLWDRGSSHTFSEMGGQGEKC